MRTALNSRAIAFALALGFALASAPAWAAVESRGFEGFDAFVEEQLVRWKVPGAAVAVVRDGEVLFAKGYGLRDVERGLPMTPQTAIPIGSLTKSMAAISIANLVRNQKLAWDRPVREWAPDFHLANDAVASQVTLRDILTHRTSFAGSDWAWYGEPQTPEELFRKMRFLELRGGLRERFQYSDIMYVAAGVIAARAAGVPSWEDLATRDIFTPLGMKSTGFSLANFKSADEPSVPYGSDAEGRPVRFEPLEARWAGPAGGFVYASTADMGRYLAMLANAGTYRGVRIVEEADLAQITNPQVILPGRSPFAELGTSHYAMGFNVRPYRGSTLVSHTGTNDGWRTRFAYFPHLRSGVYVATNGMEAAMRDVLSNPALDRLLGVEPADWSGRAMQQADKARQDAAQARAKKLQARKAGTRPSRSLEMFSGTYAHPGYGLVSIKATQAHGLAIGFRGYEWPLDHVHYDVFEGRASERSYALDPLSRMTVQFVSGLDGEIPALRLLFSPGAQPVEFARR